MRVVLEQFGAQSEGDHAQSILGLFGSPAEGGSTVIWTRHQTSGWDQRGEMLKPAFIRILQSSFSRFNQPLLTSRLPSFRHCCLSCYQATVVCALRLRRFWICPWSSSKLKMELLTSVVCPSSLCGWWAHFAPPAEMRTSRSWSRSPKLCLCSSKPWKTGHH